MKRTDALNNNGNRFKDRDLVGGTDGTILDETWLNSVQEEIAGIIETFGGSLNPLDENQTAKILLAALLKRLQYSDLPYGWIVSGLTASNIGLDVTIATGYGIAEGSRTELKASEVSRSFTVPINSDIYVALNADGTISADAVANGSPVPTQTGLVLYKIVTDGTAITLTSLVAKTSLDIGANQGNVLSNLNEQWVVSGLTASNTSNQPTVMTFADGVAIVGGVEVEIDPLSNHNVTLQDNGIHVISLLSDGTFSTTNIASTDAIPDGIQGLPLVAVLNAVGIFSISVNLSGYRRRSESPIFYEFTGSSTSCPTNTDTDLIAGVVGAAQGAWGISKHLQVSGFYGFEIPEGIKRFRVRIRGSFDSFPSAYQQQIFIRYNGVTYNSNKVNTGANTHDFSTGYFDRAAGAYIEIFGRQNSGSTLNGSVTVFIEEV